MAKIPHIALVGFANAGKTSLFNLLANTDLQVGNWSGVTVAEKSRTVEWDNQTIKLTDLPGISSLNSRQQQGRDITITQSYLTEQQPDLIVNVVDVTQLKRELMLTNQLLDAQRLNKGAPVLILLNKSDMNSHFDVDIDKMSVALNSTVLAVSANDKLQAQSIRLAIGELLQTTNADSISEHTAQTTAGSSAANPTATADVIEQVQRVQTILAASTRAKPQKVAMTERLDSLVLHPILGFPVFLGMMYLLFMFAINVGSAFIDFFDILAGHIFVSYPTHWLSQLNLPVWLTTIVEGIGSGIQTVATFIPVIACLFIGLSLFESSGYLARAAFVVEGIMTKVGLPGKAFVPLIVGFGCTVPAVMATRVMDNEAARIKTVMMAPFMSCGARLPVYALFAAAFFPEDGQNLVFLLYLIGIVAAVGTGFLLKITLLPSQSEHHLMELPSYQLPQLSYLIKRVFNRTKSFVTGAGKTIVIVVCCLNFINSIGTDGSFGHQNSQQSLLSQGAKIVTPLLSPMGIEQDNWQAGVGIITGIFAKEVLVATFNNLYSPQTETAEAPAPMAEVWQQASSSILNNLLDIKADDPLGTDVGEIADITKAAEQQDVRLTTYSRMQSAFTGQLGAFSYLLFILLYTPCVAAMGAIKNEVGTGWASFAAAWSFTLAYCVATLSFQIGNWSTTPVSSSITIAIVLCCFYGVYWSLKRKAKQKQSIPIAVKYS